MSKDLIIVESPAKVKTIKKFLGKNYDVQASVGHVRDLPPSSLGVNESGDFEPEYEVIKGKQSVVTKLKQAAAKADHVFLAPDPDREGEAIAWHVAELIKDKNTNISRIQFNEITARAVKEALEHPRDLNRKLFDSQQARRVLDRLVGYKISPLLWKKVKRGISAGRVQSVALKIICEREKERQAFSPEEYWVFKVLLAGQTPPAFECELFKVGGKKPVIGDAEAAKALEEAVRASAFSVAEVKEKERSRSPQPPFITSTLQQAANQRLGYGAKKTMGAAQRLYEGVDLGERGVTALITYMRTDSVRVSPEAQDQAQAYITEAYGKDYYPAKRRFFKTKSGAQDAHEAIRPVDVTITPDAVKGLLPGDQHKVYDLVWRRFVASQMAAARFHDTTILVDAAPQTSGQATQWRAKGERLLFDGFLKVLGMKDKNVELPKLTAGEAVSLEKLSTEQKFTQPPPRYTEASLVRELEEKGIGRPSTYAQIISTLIDREYAKLEEKHFIPTDLGMVVVDLLAEHFHKLMDVAFTARMEEDLDRVAEGDANWVDLMRGFTGDFYPTLEEAKEKMATVKGGLATGMACPDCGKDLVIKFGKAGAFLACQGYPDCRYTSNFTRDENGNVVVVEREPQSQVKVGDCPECGKDLVEKRARTGSRFIACTGYPDCRHTRPFSTGVACPQCRKGELVERSSRRGKVFYSCSEYPQCDYAVWDWPLDEPCPECGSPILVKKTTKARGEHIACPVKSCRYTRDIAPEDSGSEETEPEEA